MKKTALLLFLFLPFLAAFGQFEPTLTQTRFNRLTVNPAYAGTDGKYEFNGQYKLVDNGLSGAPNTAAFNFNMPTAKLHGGIGTQFLYDKIGNFETYEGALNYAYHINLPKGLLSFGLKTGIIINRADGFWQSTDPAAIDPLIQGQETVIAFNNGLGAYYRTNKLYAGISVNHLTDLKIKDSELAEEILFDFDPYYYGIFGYKWNINPIIALEPNTTIRYTQDFWTADIIANLHIKSLVWFGAGFRKDDAILLLAGVDAGRFKVGYSYDYYQSLSSLSSRGAHEFLVTVALDKK